MRPDHLGHSSVQMTMDTYRHKLRKQNREAAEKLVRAFFSNAQFVAERENLER